MDVHKQNTEVNTAEFDLFVEQARLQQLTRDETVEVIRFVDGVACIASTGGKLTLRTLPEVSDDNKVAWVDCYIIRYWRGRTYNPRFKRRGQPFDFGPYQIKFYHPDRVAEILRKHKEAA